MMQDALEAPRPSSRAAFVDPVNRLIGDALQDMAQIEFWVDTVKLGSAEQAVNGRRTCSLLDAGNRGTLLEHRYLLSDRLRKRSILCSASAAIVSEGLAQAAEPGMSEPSTTNRF